MNIRKQNALAILLGISIAVGLYTLSSARINHIKQDSSQKKELITSVPEVISCVKNIKIKRSEIRKPGSPDASVAIEVENTSDVGIVAISMDSTKKGESYEVISNTFDADEPKVIIKPHDTGVLEMEVSNVYPDVPLRIGSVMYADGTEAGCDSSLKSMHESKEMHKQQKAKKETEGSPK